MIILNGVNTGKGMLLNPVNFETVEAHGVNSMIVTVSGKEQIVKEKVGEVRLMIEKVLNIKSVGLEDIQT